MKHDFPVNILFWGNLDAGMALIDRHPDTRFIIDHMGILQPRTPPAPPQPWADLPKVLELAKRKNAVIKVSGACTLSKRTLSLPGHLGSAGSHLRCVGVRALSVGHGLDTCVRGRQLRAGRRAFPQDGPAERQRARDADGRRQRQGVWLVTQEGIARFPLPRPEGDLGLMGRLLQMPSPGRKARDFLQAEGAPSGEPQGSIDRVSRPAVP